MNDVERILQYWFGTLEDDIEIARAQTPLWWSKNPATDAYVTSNFETLVLAAEAGGLDDWRASPSGRLALVLLTDQFPRHIYRGTPAAFRFDPLARELCLEGLQTAADQDLTPIRRAFFYMPLEHSEQLAHQQKSVELFERLAREMQETGSDVFTGFVEFARQHKTIIERFGRFPHRNEVLGRSSRQSELDFLSEPNSSF